MNNFFYFNISGLLIIQVLRKHFNCIQLTDNCKKFKRCLLKKRFKFIMNKRVLFHAILFEKYFFSFLSHISNSTIRYVNVRFASTDDRFLLFTK